MTTQTFAPLDISFAADADATITAALDAASDAGHRIAAARDRKRRAEAALRDQEAFLTLDALTKGGAEKTNAEVRKAQVAMALATDAEMLRLRSELACVLHDIDTNEFEHEHAIKKYHAAKATLEYSTAVAHLYANGGRLQ